jgi:hypothetical protein
MDLEVFGIKLSSFIKAFRKTYDVGNGTYDYMSFLKVTDCASYCAMQQNYENPNAVLNFLITPSLNTIDVVGGKKRKMKGGAQEQYIFILILFLLAVSNVFAGPRYNAIVREFGPIPENWPKEVTEPSKPQDRFGYRFVLFYVNLGVSQEDIEKYNKDMDEFNKWKKFEPMEQAYMLEDEKERENKSLKTKIAVLDSEAALTKAKTEQTQAEDDLTRTQSYYTELAAKNSLLKQVLEQYKDEREETKEERKRADENAKEASFFKGAFYASASILGLIGFFVGTFLDGRRHSGPVSRIVRQASNALGQLPLPAITSHPNNNYMIEDAVRGGKTKTHRKKRVTRRRRH